MVREPEARPLRVLITNRTLATRTGTELYVRDLAIGLLARGHAPIVYAPFLGDIAREIRAQTIPVTDDLRTIAEPPDVIHGHHSLETLAALLAFPDVPAIAVCHSWIGWADAPLLSPRVRRYVAVDDTCRDRLRFEHGIADDRIHVALNAVDLDRFRPRAPLPTRPKRALIFSNAAGSGRAHTPAIEAACAAHGIEVEMVGASAGRSMARPEEVLRDYDLVFAKAKSALEAMSVGTAVILCDAVGAGPLVTTQNLEALRRVNFGMRALRDACTPDHLAAQIARYNAADARTVSETIRASASTTTKLDELCALYADVVDEHARAVPNDPRSESLAAAAYLQTLSPRMHERDLLAAAFHALLRRPVLARMIRRAAGSTRWRWLDELLRLRSMDGA